MGQKVHPYGFRLGVIQPWKSNWFCSKDADFKKFIGEDTAIRKVVEELGMEAGVADVIIERRAAEVRVIIMTAKPGIVIGRKGASADKLKAKVQGLISAKNLKLDIVEMRSPDLNAKLLGEWIADQILKRIPYKRAMKQALARAVKSGARGVKIMASGRLAGAEIAREEWFREGRVPLHTLKADIDFHITHCTTKFGVIGIKVWVYKSDKPTDGPYSQRRS
jgi:small subunit ribosomal protein S3